jgi:hypothetical protein
MFEWLKKLFKKKKCLVCVKILWTGEIYEYCLLEKMGKPLRQQLEVPQGIPHKDVREQLEEQIRKEFLPEPQTHRRTISKSYVAPAERHRKAISKAMKGRASSQYLKTIKKSPKIKMEEED